MPIAEGTAAVIGAGISAAGQVSSGLFGKKKAYKYNSKLQAEQAEYNRQAQERAFEQNKALSEYAYNREMEQWERENQANLDFWNMQNAYNSPAAQMQRYQAAGLNPNLIYGQSNTADQVTAASSPNYNTTPMQAEQMSGGSGVGDNFSIGDPVMEYYRVLQMQQSLENAEKQGKVLDSQANLNNMNALFGETRNNFLKSSEPYWASNAQFDNVAKKIQNDISAANLSALIFRNEKMLPLQERELTLLNDLRSQNYSFNKDMNPLRLKETKERIDNILSNTLLTDERSANEFKRGRLMDFTIDYKDAIMKYLNSDKDFTTNDMLRRAFLSWIMSLRDM